MIKFELDKNNDKTVLTIIGDASIENASKIKSKIIEVINDKHLVINLDNINKSDISFIQIILSLIEDFNNNKFKKLSFSYKNQEKVILNYLKKYGFIQIPQINDYFKIKRGKS